MFVWRMNRICNISTMIEHKLDFLQWDTVVCSNQFFCRCHGCRLLLFPPSFEYLECRRENKRRVQTDFKFKIFHNRIIHGVAPSNNVKQA